jgi:hypothetical protein
MYCSRRWRVLVDRKVRASLVIVGRVRSQQMAEMPLAEHDNVVKTFPPDRTDRCAYQKSNPAILMVQSAQDRAADDIPGPLNAAMDGGILVQ